MIYYIGTLLPMADASVVLILSVIEVQTEYGCVFGISNRTNDLKAGEVIHIHESDILIGILTGHDDIVYWFLIFSCPKLEGLDLPRYSSQDESDIVARAASMQIKPGTTFADIYKNKTRTNMSPLPYYAFERWHYKRLICIGDSIHKVSSSTTAGTFSSAMLSLTI